ncbi:hypothetical protein L9F63_001480, partial [Diploptera punctata]
YSKVVTAHKDSHISKGISAVQCQHKKVKRYNAESLICRIFTQKLTIGRFCISNQVPTIVLNLANRNSPSSSKKKIDRLRKVFIACSSTSGLS